MINFAAYFQGNSEVLFTAEEYNADRIYNDNRPHNYKLQILNKFTFAINHNLLSMLPIKYSTCRINGVSTGKIYNMV